VKHAELIVKAESCCSSGTPRGILLDMSTIVEIEKLALNLPEKERATLAANLLESLPGVLSDEDEGVAEALRRDMEIDANPDQAISLAQLDAQIKSRRG
jgi:putative addiction module component (TIGR02574 family)